MCIGLNVSESSTSMKMYTQKKKQQIDDPTSYEVTHGLYPFETHPYNVSDNPFQNIKLTNQQNNQSAVAGSQLCCALDNQPLPTLAAHIHVRSALVRILSTSTRLSHVDPTGFLRDCSLLVLSAFSNTRIRLG